MGNRLFGLRHHAIVGRHNQNHNVGCRRTTRTHRGKRFVTWGIEEGDHATRSFHVVRANVLGNPTRFA